MNLISIQTGKPQTYGDPTKKSFDEREWTTGFFKETISTKVELTPLGIRGDGQADLKVHGGPDKAICAYPQEHFDYWRATLGLNMQPGAFGENFTIGEATESSVCLGDIYRIGNAILQITQPRQPCWKLSRRWQTKNLAALVQQTGKTGWYFRILEPGNIQAPDDIQLIDRPNEQWTISKCNQIMHHAKKDMEQAAALANVPELSDSWQASLSKRVAGQKTSSEKDRLG